MSRTSAATHTRPRAVVATVAAVALAVAVAVVATLLWPRADADATVPVQRLEVPTHVGEHTLVHGSALISLDGVTCTAADGLVQAVGADMVDGWAGGIVVEDPPPTLFAIDDFSYESFQSLVYADDVPALGTGGTDCAAYLEGLAWVLLLHYPDAATAASSLTAPLDSYDELVEPEVSTGWDYLGCRTTASGSECVAPLGDVVAYVGSDADPRTLAAWSGDFLTATATATDAASAGAR
ncbi:hypothetical protein [Serinibacter arcticus]|uniref:Uncharacterized protein n=1 Tax=Serinibacter arcticus TaxID=1655435 RepID=A0A4Z1DZL6_9MICO|nr:hypothetical protein [Serinibacter arcticus]TGO05105.1 hypothetical protein SERN_1109 [Serinibacter arcticus]